MVLAQYPRLSCILCPHLCSWEASLLVWQMQNRKTYCVYSFYILNCKRAKNIIWTLLCCYSKNNQISFKKSSSPPRRRRADSGSGGSCRSLHCPARPRPLFRLRHPPNFGNAADYVPPLYCCFLLLPPPTSGKGSTVQMTFWPLPAVLSLQQRRDPRRCRRYLHRCLPPPGCSDPVAEAKVAGSPHQSQYRPSAVFWAGLASGTLRCWQRQRRLTAWRRICAPREGEQARGLPRGGRRSWRRRGPPLSPRAGSPLPGLWGQKSYN